MDEISRGWINPRSKARILSDADAWMVIDGQQAPGPLNAMFSVDHAINKAKHSGIALVGLKNTNHWLRPGYYAKLAARANCVLICWTNTIPNMLAHSQSPTIGKPTLGNNPIVIGIPNGDKPIIFDTAMSQFSYGKIQQYAEDNKPLPVAGGYSDDGNPTNNAAKIFEQLSASAIGWWKGSGLSIMLDLLAAVLTGGQSVEEVSRHEGEQNISQVFIAINIEHLWGDQYFSRIANLIFQLETDEIHWPGQSLNRTRAKNDIEGVTIPLHIWQAVLESTPNQKHH